MSKADNPLPRYLSSEDALRIACGAYWQTYFDSMRELHARQNRKLNQPIKERNLGTTDAKHIAVLEQFWRLELSTALNVNPADVGPRIIKFRPHRSKQFDVCWPLAGEPRILISIKSMQNAYRNFTNRIEEAFGDSAVLRLYRLPAVFGFFFLMLDGKVARGLAEQGKTGQGHAKSGKGKGIAPFLELIEEGGDFFELSRVEEFRKAAHRQSRGRQDTIVQAENSLLDLAAAEPSAEGAIHYDAIAFVPAKFRRLKSKPKKAVDWEIQFSSVDDRLDFRPFIQRLVDVARFRGLI